MSNFALVQLNIPKDKFRIIMLSKFCITGSFVRVDKIHSYAVYYLKNLMTSAYRTIATVLSTCWVHGVEFVVMKRVYLLVLRNRYYFRVSIGNVYICEYSSLYVSARSWSLFR